MLCQSAPRTKQTGDILTITQNTQTLTSFIKERMQKRTHDLSKDASILLHAYEDSLMLCFNKYNIT